ncbi:MAG TPA: glycosyltransferase N-terminal domain-containing protein [Longimicrobiales bacterium]
MTDPTHSFAAPERQPAGSGSPERGRLLARERIYARALAAARPIMPLLGRLDPKLARGVEGREGAVARLQHWAATARESARPLVWVHAPSVGEGLMAQAIISTLRERAPEGAKPQIAFTHFSPSAERLAARIGADVADYLPWDLPGDVQRVLEALRPDLIAYVRTEAWPVLSALAARAGARLALVNAVLSQGSSRLRGHSRFLLGPTYRRLDAVGAVAEADAYRFRRLGVEPERVKVTGDARFDQVWQRVQALVGEGGEHRNEPLLARLRQPHVTTLIAGSTWPADEERLVPAFARAREASRVSGALWRLIVAPHEPDERHLQPLEERLSEAGLAHARLAEIEAGAALPEVVVVDRVGVLADLYSVGTLAYVGGGFHSAGLHSVVEPAALALPVIFGPRHGNAREADELEDAGGGFEVSDGAELESCLTELTSGGSAPGSRTRAAAAALEYVRSRLGGAAANADLLLRLLG